MDSYKTVLRYEFVYGSEIWVVSVLEDDCSLTDAVLLIDCISWLVETELSRCTCLHDSCVSLTLLKDWANRKSTWGLGFFTIGLLSHNYDFHDENWQFFNVVGMEKQKLLITSLHHTWICCRGNKLLKLWWISSAVKTSCFVHLTIVKCSIVLHKVLSLGGHRLCVVFETGILQRQFLHTLQAYHVSSWWFVLLVVR